MDQAEPHPQHARDDLVVRPETRIRVVVGVVAAVVIVGCGAVGALMADEAEAPAFLRLLTVVGVLALAALVRTAGWHTLRSVRIDGPDLVLEHADRTVRTVPLAQIGGLGYRGTSVAGYLFDGITVGGMASAGRLIVVDKGGRLLIARRAGWMSFADLQGLCSRSGLAWVGYRSFLVPVVPVPSPTVVPVAVDPVSPAEAVPAISVAVSAAKRARRFRLGAYVGVLVAGIALCMVGAWLPEGRQPEGAVIFVGVVAIFAGIFLLLLAPLNNGRPRPMVKALRKSRWSLCECVVAAGLDRDTNKRLLGVVGPDGRGAPVSWWKLGTGGGRGWLQDGERGWFWVAWNDQGRATAIATIGMDRFAVIPKENVRNRQHGKSTEAYLRACELEYWNPDAPAGVAGPPLGLAPEGPTPGWGSAPTPSGAAWPAPAPAPGTPPPGWVPPPHAAVPTAAWPAPAPVPGTPPPGWVPPPAWQAPPAWDDGVRGAPAHPGDDRGVAGSAPPGPGRF